MAATIPRQTNTYDCGAFVLTLIRYMVLKLDYDFKQKDTPLMRYALAHDLWTWLSNPGMDKNILSCKWLANHSFAEIKDEPIEMFHTFQSQDMVCTINQMIHITETFYFH